MMANIITDPGKIHHIVTREAISDDDDDDDDTDDDDDDDDDDTPRIVPFYQCGTVCACPIIWTYALTCLIVKLSWT